MSVFKRTRTDGSEQWHYRKLIRLRDRTKLRIHGTPSINTKLEAERAEREHIDRVLNPPPVVVVEEPKLRRTFDEAADAFVRDHVKVRNKRSEIYGKENILTRYLRPLLGKVPIDEIRGERIVALTAALSRMPSQRGGTLKAKTVNNILQVVRKILNWALRQEWLDKVPVIDRLPTDTDELRCLSDVELTALLDAARSEPIWTAAILLGADAGMRQGEIRAFQWDRYSVATGEISVSKSRWRGEDGSTKSRRARSVPATSRLAAALAAVAKTSKLRGPYVLSRPDGKPLGVDAMNGNLTRLYRRAGIVLGDQLWHALRHTFCSRLAMLGVPARTIQELAGHASLTTTMRYMHLAVGEKNRAVALLDGAVARAWREPQESSDNESEGGAIVRLELATLTGFEPVLLA